MRNNQKVRVNWRRVSFAVGYFLLAIILAIIFWDDMIYPKPIENSYNLFRFLWCIACSFIGFAVLAYRLRHLEKTPWPSYLTYYLPVMIAVSAFVFAAFHAYVKTSGYVFYYASGSVCFLMANLIDYIFKIIISWLKRRSERI